MEVAFDRTSLLARPGVVMTPRAATARLVARAAELAGDRRVRVADVGTGSGAIAVALALRVPGAEIWATDTSPAAVALAQVNAEWHRVASRVHMLEGDLLSPVPGRLDLVVANLPYLPTGEPDDELAGEPPDALYAPGDGLGPYRSLVDQARTRLEPHGVLLVQLRRRVLEATALELPLLRRRLDEPAFAPAA